MKWCCVLAVLSLVVALVHCLPSPQNAIKLNLTQTETSGPYMPDIRTREASLGLDLVRKKEYDFGLTAGRRWVNVGPNYNDARNFAGAQFNWRIP